MEEARIQGTDFGDEEMGKGRRQGYPRNKRMVSKNMDTEKRKKQNLLKEIEKAGVQIQDFPLNRFLRIRLRGYKDTNSNMQSIVIYQICQRISDEIP